MSFLTDLQSRLTPLGSQVGYAATGQELPYVVVRPLYLGPAEDLSALSGDGLGWDEQASAYCAGASVEASYNLAVEVMQLCSGRRAGGGVMRVSFGYVGAPVEGHYETQVTIQINKGEL